MSLFHCETMQYVSFYMHFDDATMVAVVLANSGFFDPSRAKTEDENLPDQQGMNYREIFNHALSDWKKSIEYLLITPSEKVNTIFPVNKPQLLEIENQLVDIWKICAAHLDQQRLLDSQLNSLSHLFKLLDHFSNLDINFDLLKIKLEFLDIHLGIIPVDYIPRLKQALAIEGYYLSVYIQEAENAHIIVAGIKQASKNIELLLESASFQRLIIPEEFHENPQIVYQKLTIKKTFILQQVDSLGHELTLLKEKFGSQLIQLGELLSLAKPYAVLSHKMLGKGQLTVVEGWIPASKIALIKKDFDHYIKQPVVIQVRQPNTDEYAITPSYVLRPKWLSPFISLMTNFGVPRYKEFDPSWFFSLSYILMFGLMFGDVGHGICLMGISLLMRNGFMGKKWSGFYSYFLSIGLASSFFGFLYGSIFSYEHILPALWLSPIQHPILMMKLSIIWGGVFIIIFNLISIYNRLLVMKLKEALFSPYGLSGLLLYMTFLWALFDLSRDQFSNLNLLFMALTLLLIFGYYWNKGTRQIMECLLVSLIESYDVILAYLSNTISFLRVAAFAINHGALAIALYTLASLSEGSLHWLVIILGNLFILFLEGAIVAIQVLRLEYYEGFSRFFNGDGYLFKPLELSPQKLTNN